MLREARAGAWPPASGKDHMSIEEMRQLANLLASDITALVAQFEATTGVEVHSLALEHAGKGKPDITVRTRVVGMTGGK